MARVSIAAKVSTPPASIAANAIRSAGAARRAPAAAARARSAGAARRRLAVLAATALLAAAFASGCGSGGDTTTAVPDKAADAEVLNRVLAREMAAIGAYGRILPLLHGPDLAASRRFRAQEQEHLDAVVKALRGLGAGAEPEAEAIESERLRTRADALRFLYEIESVSIDDGLRAISNLTAPWPRSLLGSIVANQAQHLVLLRRALGAGPLAAIPEAFENGTAPAPGESEGGS